MATEVLRAHDCVENSLSSNALPAPPPAKSGRSANSHNVQASPCRRSPPSPSKPFRSNHKNNQRNHLTPARSERRSPTPGSRRPMVEKFPVRKLVMEEVTILKRGEVLKDPPVAEDHQQPCREEETEGGGDLALCSTDMLGPGPEILPKQVRLVDRKPSLYAGLGFVTSPSPSSLPFPASFLAKKDGRDKMDLATKGLRYLLRLDLP